MVVALVRMEEEAFKLVRLAVVAFKVVPLNKVSPSMLELRVMLGVLPPEEDRLFEAVTEVTPPAEVVVAITLPLPSTARTVAVNPDRTKLEVVALVLVMLVKTEVEAFKLVKVEVVALRVPLMFKRLLPLIQEKLFAPARVLAEE